MASSLTKEFLKAVSTTINRSFVDVGTQIQVPPPPSKDWRELGAVTAVQKQGANGTCYAYAIAGAIEGINAIMRGKLIPLSAQHLIDCDFLNSGDKGASLANCYAWIIHDEGIALADAYRRRPKGNSGICKKVGNSKKLQIKTFVRVEPTDAALFEAVERQPISACIHYCDFLHLTGEKVFEGCPCKNKDINHGVLIVGYGNKDGIDCWIIKNSHGESFGVKGYFYLKRDPGLPGGVAGIHEMALYPTL